MRRAAVIALGAMWLVACASGEREGERASLGALGYAVPEGWTMQDVSERGSTIVVWTPPSNPRKQSITLVRTPALPAIARAGEGQRAALLAAAQASLPSGSFLPARAISTKHGLVGVRIDGRFTPAGSPRSYQRAHVVIVDGDALVHILYTAGTPDAGVLDLVLAELARKAA